jgi:proline iminopeptidase
MNERVTSQSFEPVRDRRSRRAFIASVGVAGGIAAISGTFATQSPQSASPSTRSITVSDGKVAVRGGNVWYRVVGAGKGTPVLLLHGGPGIPSDYLQPLDALGDERPVVFYDQLGCGKSDRPDDTSLWRVERFVDELATVRRELGLNQVHLYGHSWGATLAVEYMLTKPEGVESLVLASPLISTPRWISDQDKYREALPKKIQEILNRHEKAGTTDSTEYADAAMQFYKRHLCRLDPYPEAIIKALEGEGRPVYRTMWGPSEFHATGNLKEYDLTDRLKEISTPTILTCGFFDEATPESTRYFQSLIPGAEMVVFQKSAHVPHLEETEEYLKCVRIFFDRVDKGSPADSKSE